MGRSQMRSRIWWRSLWMILVAAAFAQAAEQPNLLLFMADDLTYTDLGFTGHPDVKTPHLDRLASDSLQLTRCYTPTPTCSPCRQALYTGIYPVRNGAHPNHSRVFDHVKAMPRVAILGKRHEAPAAIFDFEQLGGAHGDGGKTPDGDDLPLDRARAFLERPADKPWCLLVTSNQPHSPWNRGDASAYDAAELTVPPYLVDTPELRRLLTQYYAEITYMDGQVGDLLALVRGLEKKQPRARSTAFVWLSEQGSELPFCKWTCYDTGIHAAALVHWPGTVAPGKSDALISYVDILPTFLELAGADPTDAARYDFDGKSFAALLRGKRNPEPGRDRHHDIVFATHTTRGIYNGSEAYATRAATDGTWLYIRNLHPDETFQNMVTARKPFFKTWQTAGPERFRAYQTRPADELFHLAEDPWCLNNLAGKKTTKQARLSAALDQWMKQQGDLGDATERAAKTRQSSARPWSKKGVYQQPKPAQK